MKLTRPLGDILSTENFHKVIKSNPECQFIYDIDNGMYVRAMQFGASPTFGSNNNGGYTQCGSDMQKDKGEKVEGDDSAGKIDVSDIMNVLSQRNVLESIINTFAVHRRNYAEGIITCQIRNDRIRRIKPPPTILQQTMYNEPLSAEPAENSESTIEKARIIKLKKSFQDSLEHQAIPKEITNLLLVSILLFAGILFFCGLEYGISEKILLQLQDTFEIAWFRANIFHLIGDSSYLSLTLTLTGTRFIQNFENFNTSGSYIENLREQLGTNIGKMQTVLKNIEKNANRFEKIDYDLLLKKDVVMNNYGLDGIIVGNDNITFIEACLQISSALLSIKRTPIELLHMKNQDLFDVRDNYFNGLSVKMPKSYINLHNTLHGIAKDDLGIEIKLFLITTGFIVFFVILTLPYIIQAKGSKKNVLANFLKIPKVSLNELTSKCERYLNHAETEDMPDNNRTINDNGSEDKSEYENGELSELASDSEIVSRQFRGESNEITGLFIKSIFVIIVLDAYYFFCYYYTVNKGNDVETLYDSIDAICGLEENTLNSFNVLREAILQTNMNVINLNDKISVAETLIKNERSLLENILESTILKSKKHNKGSIVFTKNWLHAPICNSWDAFSLFTNKTNCEKFISGITGHGTYSLISEYIFTFRRMLSIANLRRAEEFLNSQEWVSQWQLIHYVLSVQFEKFNNYYQNQLNEQMDSTLRLKVGVLLGFTFGILFIFLAFWVPYLIQLRTELWRTDGMLVLIPNNVIFHNKLLKDLFVRKNPYLTQ